MAADKITEKIKSLSEELEAVISARNEVKKKRNEITKQYQSLENEIIRLNMSGHDLEVQIETLKSLLPPEDNAAEDDTNKAEETIK